MKPLAYISKNGIVFKELPPEPMDLEPLYPAKTLTDEEITKIYNQIISIERNSWHEFARAILKKASEK